MVVRSGSVHGGVVLSIVVWRLGSSVHGPEVAVLSMVVWRLGSSVPGGV